MKFKIDLKILFFLVLFFITGQIEIYFFVLLFALLHELAHFAIGTILGVKLQYIELTPFGFFMILNPKPKDYKSKIFKSNMVELKYIFIAIAGPLLNLIFVIIFSNINFSEEFLKYNGIKQIIIYSNLLLLVFNFVPIYPLDGGRVFRSILRIFLGKKIADETMNIIANISIIILTIVGSIVILYLKNIAILLILAYLWELVIFENKRMKLKKMFYKLE